MRLMPPIWPCHGETEYIKWWFILAFPVPLQTVAQQCFCFFFSFSFFSDTIFSRLAQVYVCGKFVIKFYLFISHSYKPLSQY